jgi:WD40 repeat protein
MRNTLIIFVAVMFVCNLSAQRSEYYTGEVLKYGSQINSIDINGDDSQLLIGGEDKQVVLVDLQKGKVILEMEAHYLPVAEVKFSNIYDGFYTIGDRSFKLWLMGSDKAEELYTGSHTSITDWDSSADETFFVGSSYEKGFRYWKKSVLDEPQDISTSQDKNVVSVALGRKHKILAAGSLDSTIELWNTEGLSRKVKILAHGAPVCCLEFIENDQYLISASHDGYAKLWDCSNGEIVKVYPGHIQAINAVSVSPDGKYLLTAGYDKTIGLYAIATGQCIYRYQGHEAPVFDVKWNHKGDGFYSSDKDGTIIEWSVPTKVFVDFYFQKEMNDEIQNSSLFNAKRKGESRDDYKQRQMRAERFKQKLYETYSEKYKELIEKQIIGEI